MPRAIQWAHVIAKFSRWTEYLNYIFRVVCVFWVTFEICYVIGVDVLRILMPQNKMKCVFFALSKIQKQAKPEECHAVLELVCTPTSKWYFELKILVESYQLHESFMSFSVKSFDYWHISPTQYLRVCINRCGVEHLVLLLFLHHSLEPLSIWNWFVLLWVSAFVLLKPFDFPLTTEY